MSLQRIIIFIYLLIIPYVTVCHSICFDSIFNPKLSLRRIFFTPLSRVSCREIKLPVVTLKSVVISGFRCSSRDRRASSCSCTSSAVNAKCFRKAMRPTYLILQYGIIMPWLYCPGSWRVYRGIYSIRAPSADRNVPFNRMQPESFHPDRRIIRYSSGNSKNLYRVW